MNFKLKPCLIDSILGFVVEWCLKGGEHRPLDVSSNILTQPELFLEYI